MPNKRIVGVSPWSNPDYDLIKAAGIEWVRLGFSFPFKDKLHGEYDKKFLDEMDNAKKVAGLGLKIMGITPLAGAMAFEKSDNQTAWRPGVPEWAGSIDSDGYYDAYEQACAEIGRLTIEFAPMWQVSNEMDIDVFHGPLSLEQSARYMLAGARGLKKGNPDCRPGINPAVVHDPSRYLYKELYSRAKTPFGYAGIDGYFGSWQAGQPQDWVLWLQEIHDLTRQDVLVNEWGYSAIGKLQDASMQGKSVCEAHAWNNVWKKEHCPEEQGAYLRIGLKIFATYPDCLGSFLYDWGDDAVCYHCGRTECPSECGWGIADSQGKPKASYYAFKETVATYY